MFVVVLLCSQWHSWEGLGDQGEVGMGVGAKVGAHGVVGTAVVAGGRVGAGAGVWGEVGKGTQEFLGGVP